MEKNFSVGQANELILGGSIFDLHNWRDFAGLLILSSNRIQLWFTRGTELGADGDVLVLEVEGVSVLELTNGLLLGNCRDVVEIGYKNPEDLDLNWLVDEAHATEADHLVFRFGSEDHIRIYGAHARLHVRDLEEFGLRPFRDKSSKVE